jgi:hypothetical protein
MMERGAPAVTAPRRLGLRLNDVLFWTGMALIGAVAAAGLVEPLLSLTRFVPLDPNEGWNALLARIAMHGGTLYPSPAAGQVINNYPPLSFYIVGLAGRAVGDNIFAGRMLSLASMLVVAGNLGLWLRASGAGSRSAWLGAGVFTAFAVTYAQSYAGMDDPQWLAHAIMTSGLVVIWRGQAGSRAIAIAALLMLAGGWTKHLLIPLPIATTWWLLRRSRPAFLTWVGVGAVLLGATALLVWALYGPAFFESLHSARQYSLRHGIKEFRQALRGLAPLIALSLALIAASRSEPREFALVYLGAAAAVAFAAAGGTGVDINAFFDLMIAASLCTALAADAFWDRYGAAVTLILGVCLAQSAASAAPAALRDLRNLDALESRTLADVRLIARLGQGRAACETPELCYWANQDFRVDFFNYGQRLLVGKAPLADCAAVFDGRSIPLIQLDVESNHDSRQLPAPCNALIRQNYRTISAAPRPLGLIMTASGTP